MPAPLPSPSSESATEIVIRPEPGLARGKWEAPAWAFWAMLALILAASAAYLLFRLGWLRSTKRADAPAPPIRMRRS